MSTAHPEIVSLIATTLLLHVPFLTLKQIVELCMGLLPPGLDHGKCTELVRNVMRPHIASGLLQIFKDVTMFPDPMLVRDRPIHVWHQDDPRLDADVLEDRLDALMDKHRRRLPKTGNYKVLNLYFASPRTSELADGVTPIIDSQIVGERLEQEEREKCRLKRTRRLHLDQFVPKEFQDHVADRFINCHFNMAWAYLKKRVSDPNEAQSWQPCIVRKVHSTDDYPHAVRSSESGEIAMFFGGSLGPVITRAILEKLAGSYVTYVDY